MCWCFGASRYYRICYTRKKDAMNRVSTFIKKVKVQNLARKWREKVLVSQGR